MGREKAGFLRSRKAFQLLSKLSTKELKGFRNFLESPLFNPHASRRKALLALFDRACKLKVWERAVLHETFVKGTQLPAHRNAFDKLVSAFYEKLDEYVSILAFREDKAQQNMAAIRFMEARGASSEALQKRIHLAEKFLESTPRDAAYFHARLNFDLEFAQSLSSRLAKIETGRFGHLHANLDQYFYIQKLRFLCATINEKHLIPGFTEPPSTSEAMSWIQRFENPPLLGQLYHQSYQLLSGKGSPDDALLLLDLLQQDSCRAFKADVQDIYGYLTNYYIRQLNKGDTSALPLLDQLHGGMLQLHLTDTLACISHDNFKNIVSVKCKLGNFDGARAFMTHYKERLCDGLDGIVLRYNTAVVYFHERNFLSAIPILEALMEVNGRAKVDQFLGLDSRGILLKCYYEVLDLEDVQLPEWESLLEKAHALIHAFKAFIARRELSEARKAGFTHFWSLSRSLFQLRFESFIADKAQHKTAWQTMKAKVLALGHFPDRDWFLEKVQGRI